MGGKERLLVDFVERLDPDEFEVGICALGVETETSRILAGRGYRVWTLGRPPEARLDWGLVTRVHGVVAAMRPSVVHVHGLSSFFASIPCSLWGAPPVVFTCHFSLAPQIGTRRLVTAVLMRHVRAVVAVSNAAREVCKRAYHVPRRRLHMIYNGVDTVRFAPSDRAGSVPLTIGFCGVFRVEKQVPSLLEAVAALRAGGARASLLLVGDGPTRRDCQAASQALGLADCVEWAGSQRDVRPWLSRMDIFVLPSSQEAMPVALIEAMAMGLPVVASAVGGVPEIVLQGRSGLLFEPGNSGQLAAHLGRLTREPRLRAELGAQARRTVVERFSIDRMMLEYAGLYRAVSPTRTPV